MNRIFEVKPLLIAAAIGAVALVLLHKTEHGWTDAAMAVGIGIAVQVGVRAFGVS